MTNINIDLTVFDKLQNNLAQLKQVEEKRVDLTSKVNELMESLKQLESEKESLTVQSEECFKQVGFSFDLSKETTLRPPTPDVSIHSIPTQSSPVKNSPAKSASIQIGSPIPSNHNGSASTVINTPRNKRTRSTSPVEESPMKKRKLTTPSSRSDNVSSRSEVGIKSPKNDTKKDSLYRCLLGVDVDGVQMKLIPKLAWKKITKKNAPCVDEKANQYSVLVRSYKEKNPDCEAHQDIDKNDIENAAGAEEINKDYLQTKQDVLQCYTLNFFKFAEQEYKKSDPNYECVADKLH